MAEPFDPDAFLANEDAVAAPFDPDAFLAETAAPIPAAPLVDSDGIELANLADVAPSEDARWRMDQERKLAEDEAAAAKRADDNAFIRAGFEGALQAPDDEGAIQKLATHFRVPTDAAATYKVDLDIAYKAAKFDPETFQQENPELARMLLRDRETNKTVHKDVKLSGLVKAFRFVQDKLQDYRGFVQETLGGRPGALAEAAGLATNDTAELNRINAIGPEAVAAEREQRDAPKKGQFLDNPAATYIREQAPHLAPFGELSQNWEALAIAELYSQIANRVLLGKEGQLLGQDVADLERQVIDRKRLNRKLDLGEAGTFTDILTGSASTAYVMTPAKTGRGSIDYGLGILAAPVAGFVASKPGGKLLVGAVIATSSFQLEQGSVMEESADWRTDKGEALTKRERAASATVYAAGATAIELGEFGILAGLGKSAGAFRAPGGKKAFRDAFRALTLRSPEFRGLLLRAGAALAGEPAEEGTQALFQSTIAYFAKSLKQGELQAKGIGQAEVEDALEQAGAVMPFSVAQTAMAAAVGRLAGALDRDRNLTGNGQVEAIAEMKESPTVQAAPAAVARLIEDTTSRTGNPVTHMYVDAEVLGTTALFQSANAEEGQKESIEELLGPGGAKKLEDAIAIGGKVEIPMPLYLEKWAGTPTAVALAEHTTTRAAHLTPAQLAEDPKLIEEQARLVVEEADRVAAQEAEAEKLFVKLETDLSGAVVNVEGKKKPIGKGGAKKLANLYRSAYRAAAASYGHDAAAQHLDDARVAIANGEDLGAGMLQAAAPGPLEERAANPDPEQRAIDINIDPETGLRNFEAWTAEPRQKGRPIAAVTLLIKPVNDHPKGGHDTANAFLAKVAPIIHAADPEAARKGPTFLFHGDQAALDGVTEAMRKQLPAGFEVVGQVGDETNSTLEALEKQVDAGRKSGSLPADRSMTSVDLTKLPELEAALGARQPVAPNLSERMRRNAGALSAEDMGKVYRDRVVPQLLSAQGWRHIPRKAFTASLDLRGLKVVNDTFSRFAGDREAGNKFIKHFGEVAVKAGAEGVDMAHLSGDEYAIQANSEAELDDFLDRLDAALRKNNVHVKLGDRTFPVKVRFRDGIGESYGLADRDLNEQKLRETAGADLPRAAGRDARAAARAEARVSRGVPGDAARAGDGGDAGQSDGEKGRDAGDVAERSGPTWFEQDPRTPEEIAAQRAAFDTGSNLTARAWAHAELNYIIGEGKRPGNGGLSDRQRREITLDLSRNGFVDPDLKLDLATGHFRFERLKKKSMLAQKKKGKGKKKTTMKERLAFKNQISGKDSGGSGDLHQFPSREESIEGMRVLQVLLDYLREKGAKPVETNQWDEVPQEGDSTRATDPLSAARWWARSVSAHGPIDALRRMGLEGAPGDQALKALKSLSADDVRSIHEAELADGWRDAGSRAALTKAFDMAGGAEKLAVTLRGTLVAEYENLDANVRRVDRGTGRVNEMYGGEVAATYQRAIGLELDNASETAGPESARIPNSRRGFKPTPGQAELEAYLNAVNADKTRLFQPTEAEQQLQSAVRDALAGKEVSPERLAELRELFAGDAADPRGSVRHVRQGLRDVFMIALNPNADLSTFLHESGHVFLELLTDLGQRADATPQAKADLAAVLKWFGIEDPTTITRNEQGWSFTREQHEKFADGFLVYLREGKSPSPALAKAFKAFSDWLKAIYKSVAQLGVELNPEIRGVFDRLLATDEEIDAMRRQMGKPLFGSLAEALAAGLSPEKYAEWLEDQALANSSAERAAKLRIRKEELRKKDKQWKADLEVEVTAAEAEYEALPARRAQLILAGKGTDEYLGLDMALDRAAVEAAVGEAAAKKFRLAKEGGVNPDELAPDLGFETGAEMLKEVELLPPKDVWAKKRAEWRMGEKHPGVLEDREQLRELVGKGLHGDDSERSLLKEIEALTAKAPDGSRPVEAIQYAAKQMVERLEVGHLNASRALQAERKAANLAVKALAKGNFGEVLVQKHRQLLAMYMYRELQKAREERQAFVELAQDLRKTKSRQAMGKASPVLRDGVDFLLEAFGLKEVVPTTADLAAVVKVLEDQAASKVSLQELQDLVAKRGAGDWTNLTLAKMRILSNALKNIQGTARFMNTVILDEKRASKAEVVAETLAAIDKALIKKPAGYGTTGSSNTVLEDLGGLYNSVTGSLLRPNTMLQDLADGDPDSIIQRAFIDPLRKAKHVEADLAADVAAPIVEAFEAVPKSARARFREELPKGLFKNHSDKARPPRYRYELLMMLLNAGNEGNLSRLLGGVVVNPDGSQTVLGRNISLEELTEALNLLTKEEIDWAQSVLDAHEMPRQLRGETEARSLKDRAFDQEERDTGIRPEAVRARPLVLKNGTFRGGYFPAVYDRSAEQVGERQAAQALAELFDPSYTRPGTSTGHLKARVPDFIGIISLEPATIYSHLGKQIHDVAFRDAVKSVGSLVLDPEIDAALKRYLGDGKARQFLKWMKDIGSSNGMLDNSMQGLEKLTQFVRGNMGPAILGWKLTTALGDVGNLTAAIAATPLKAKYLATGVSAFMNGRTQARKVALELSGELRFQQDTLQRDFAKNVKSLTSRWRHMKLLGPLAWWKDHAFAFLEYSQAATATPIWIGAFRQALDEGRDTDAAAKWADNIINQVFPSHSVVDQSAILRNKGFWGFSTMFYGYMNTAYNMQHAIARPLFNREFAESGKGDKAKTVAKVSGAMLALYLSVGALSELFAGRGPEDGDDDDEPSDDPLARNLARKRNWLVRKTVVAPLSLLPFNAGRGVEAWWLDKRQAGTSGTLVDSYVAALGKGVIDTFDGDSEVEKKLLATTKVLGLTMGVGTSPIGTTGKYVFDALNGAEEQSPADVASGLMYGRREGQPENPITFFTGQ